VSVRDERLCAAINQFEIERGLAVGKPFSPGGGVGDSVWYVATTPIAALKTAPCIAWW
jgi:hypothetical protein